MEKQMCQKCGKKLVRIRCSGKNLCIDCCEDCGECDE
jgi:hypothetical protein